MAREKAREAIEIMTTTWVADYRRVPTLHVDGHPVPAEVAYVRPEHMGPFLKAGFRLFTVTTPTRRGAGIWWLGPGWYDFSAIDQLIEAFLQASADISGSGDILFMPRFHLAPQGFPWWEESHPGEMTVLRHTETGEVLDPRQAHPDAPAYLGHEVHLQTTNVHSFHSEVWREDAAQALRALISHCESAPYADHLWGYHICDGLFQEWFHWNEYAFDGLADYSSAAQRDFRAWLLHKYHADADRLSRSWEREVHFDAVEIPLPRERLRPTHMEFYDPARDRPAIDYMQCFSEAIVDSIAYLCRAVKDALPQPKVVGVFYGYPFTNMPRPQLNGHYALGKLLQCPDLDFVASPHIYDNRGHGGYHSPQCVSDSVRRAGKLHFDEVDCKTIWTPKTVTWKTYISQPTTLPDTLEMMKKDAAYHMASGTGMWWMDLTNEGWFDSPQVVEPMRRLQTIEERLMKGGRSGFGQIALVVDERSTAYHAYRAGLNMACLLMLKQWHMSRLGAPFQQLLLHDLARENTPDYELYIFANSFHLNERERAMVDRKVKRNGATALWVYASGFLDDHEASLENMERLTGIHCGCRNHVGDLSVQIIRHDHPLTQDLPQGFAYGTDVASEEYTRPPRIQYLPEMAVGPAFFADDPEAEVLGIARGTGRPGLVVKEFDAWRSIYTAAPPLSWALLRNIARLAGVHLYSETGDMVWGNDSFLSLYTQRAGPRKIRFPEPVTVEDAYEGRVLAVDTTSVDVEMARHEAKLLLLERQGTRGH
jgi:hypothetical protein